MENRKEKAATIIIKYMDVLHYLAKMVYLEI
jgi:hypothetical protein